MHARTHVHASRYLLNGSSFAPSPLNLRYSVSSDHEPCEVCIISVMLYLRYNYGCCTPALRLSGRWVLSGICHGYRRRRSAISPIRRQSSVAISTSAPTSTASMHLAAVLHDQTCGNRVNPYSRGIPAKPPSASHIIDQKSVLCRSMGTQTIDVIPCDFLRMASIDANDVAVEADMISSWKRIPGIAADYTESARK